MTTMNKYLVKLLPLGNFFFGGDMMFKINNEDTAFSSYIIHSFMIPQQTSILGMLRYLILSNNTDAFDICNNHIKNIDKANELIGETSFTVCNNNHLPNNYKSIKNIGPCFILDIENNKSYFKSPKDIDIKIIKEKTKYTIINATINLMPHNIPYIIMNNEEQCPFIGKKTLHNYYSSLDGCRYEENELFKEDSRIGINKSYTGKTENEALYKQISYQLNKNFCFAFEVDVADTINLTDYNKQIVKLGADNSYFIFNAERIENIKYPVQKNELRTVLISDTYLPDISKCKIQFAITDVRPFRFLNIKNSIDDKSYNVNYKFSRSKERYDLFQAGSVFYFDNNDDKKHFCSQIDKYAEFKQIGYNRYY